MPSKPVRYRAVADLYFADTNGEHHVAPGELVPVRFEVPEYWITDGRVVEA